MGPPERAETPECAAPERATRWGSSPGGSTVPERAMSDDGALGTPAHPIRVLMADDDDSIATVVKTALRLDGFELIRARDGEEALQLARAADVDLILLDVQMPLLDGFAVCRALRADPALAAIPIIMLTGQRDPEDLQAGFAEGATDYITKPFAVAQLRARVRTWLARSGRASP